MIVSDPTQGRLLTYDFAGTQLASVPLPEAGDAIGGIALGEALEAVYVLHNETRAGDALDAACIRPTGP